ncbi:hypothetical protein DPMN_074453 [Dreissena polymorpha]|uniref:Uncharacterized protein n=1 Tax=Dreissena polymorpha TaxID=45954 RepID=A0A9D4BNE0_DREPO|nr:hypothetical protein DPMN_074453 [Dreissena polymorpha]
MRMNRTREIVKRSESGKEITVHRDQLRLLVNTDEVEEFRDNQKTTSGNSIPDEVVGEVVEEVSDKKTMDASKEVEQMEDDDNKESFAGDLVYFSRGWDVQILDDDIDPGEQRNEDMEDLIEAEDRVDAIVKDVPESTAGDEEENNKEEKRDNLPHQVDLSQEDESTEEPGITEYPLQDQDEEIEVPVEIEREFRTHSTNVEISCGPWKAEKSWKGRRVLLDGSLRM